MKPSQAASAAPLPFLFYMPTDLTPPHQNQSVSAYNDAARVAEYDAKMEIMHPNRAKMADTVGALPPFQCEDTPTILDLGTGTGFLIKILIRTTASVGFGKSGYL